MIDFDQFARNAEQIVESVCAAFREDLKRIKKETNNVRTRKIQG